MTPLSAEIKKFSIYNQGLIKLLLIVYKQLHYKQGDGCNYLRMF